RAAVRDQQAHLRLVGTVERVAPKVDPQFPAPAVGAAESLPVARLKRPHSERGNTAYPLLRLFLRYRYVLCQPPPVARRLKVDEPRHDRLRGDRRSGQGWSGLAARQPAAHARKVDGAEVVRAAVV